MKPTKKDIMKSIINNDENEFDQELDIVGPSLKQDFKSKLKEIKDKIDFVGFICDSKLKRSIDDYTNTIKSSKAQLFDDITKLNFKLVEIKKQNTKEDFMNKLKTDLNSIKLQVQQKDKELDSIIAIIKIISY